MGMHAWHVQQEVTYRQTDRDSSRSDHVVTSETSNTVHYVEWSCLYISDVLLQDMCVIFESRFDV
jgi:hypothetical protein